MAVFTADAFAQFECAAALALGHVQRVACQALRRSFGTAESKNFGHSLADFAGKSAVGFRVLIFYDPYAVFILEHAIIGARDDASVAGGGGTRAGPGVFSDCLVCFCGSERESGPALRVSLKRRRCKNANYSDKKRTLQGARGLESGCHFPFGRDTRRGISEKIENPSFY